VSREQIIAQACRIFTKCARQKILKILKEKTTKTFNYLHITETNTTNTTNKINKLILSKKLRTYRVRLSVQRWFQFPNVKHLVEKALILPSTLAQNRKAVFNP
jgi:hypothetical protein